MVLIPETTIYFVGVDFYMAFIVDVYDRFDSWDREHSIYKFKMNEQWYAIKEVILFWGQPQLPLRVGDEKNPKIYSVYEDMEEAMEFVKRMKKLNAR